MQVKTIFQIKPRYITVNQQQHLLLEKQILEQVYVEDSAFKTMIQQYNHAMEYLSKNERKLTSKQYQDAIYAIATIQNTLHASDKKVKINIQFKDDHLKRMVQVTSLQQLLTVMFYNLAWCRLNENDPDQMTKYLDTIFYVKQANMYDPSLIQEQLKYLKYYATVCYNVGEFALLVDDTVKPCEKTIDELCPLVRSRGINELIEVDVPKLNIEVQSIENETSQLTTETETLHYRVVNYRPVPQSVTLDVQLLQKPQFNQITSSAIKIQNIISEGQLNDEEFEFFKECHYFLTALQCTDQKLIIENIKAAIKSESIKQYIDTLSIQNDVVHDYFGKEVKDELTDEKPITIQLYPKNYFAGIQKQCEYINQYNYQLQNYINTHKQLLLNKQENINKLVELELQKFDSVLSTLKLPEKIQQPNIQEFNHSVKKLYDSYVSLLQTDVQNNQRYQWSSKGFQAYIQQIIAKVCKVGDCINQIVKYYNEYNQLDYDKCSEILNSQEELFQQKKEIIQNEINNNKLGELANIEYKQLNNEKDLLAFYLEYGFEQITEQNFREIQTKINQRSPQLALLIKEQDAMLSNLQALIPKVTTRIIEGKYGINLTDARNTLTKLIELSNNITRLNQQIQTTIDQLKTNLSAVGNEYKKQVQDQFEAQKNQQQMRFNIKIDNTVIPLQTDIE